MTKSWTVFCVQQLSKPIASLPPDVSSLLGIRRGEPKIARGHPSRQVGFIDHGEQVLRVIGLRQSPGLFAQVMTTSRGVAVATVAPQLSFQIPQAVLQHLGYSPRPARDDLLLAWAIPTVEYTRYKKAAKRGKTLTEEPHIYLSRAEFLDLHRSKSPATESLLIGRQLEGSLVASAK